MSSKLAPSILSADFSKLGDQALEATRAGADYLHIDVMDGHFVPNISFGAAVMKSLDPLETAPYDVHLMIEDPDRYLGDFVTENTAFITVHQEACVHLDRTLDHIRSYGVAPGVALNPATPLGMIEHVLDQVGLVLIMSVNPGFGGQHLIPYTLDKIRKLRDYRAKKGLDFQIEIDGGVKADNCEAVADAGADILVAGSAVFGRDGITDRVKALKALI